MRQGGPRLLAVIVLRVGETGWGAFCCRPTQWAPRVSLSIGEPIRPNARDVKAVTSVSLTTGTWPGRQSLCQSIVSVHTDGTGVGSWADASWDVLQDCGGRENPGCQVSV